MPRRRALAADVVPVSLPEGSKLPRRTATHPAGSRLLMQTRGTRRPGEDGNHPGRGKTADFLAGFFQPVGMLDPPRQAALAMLHFALKAAPGFLQAALRPCSVSIVEVPATWCEVVGACWKELAVLGEEAEPEPDIQVADAFQRRHPTCCAIVVTSGQQGRAKLDEQVKDALARRRPIVGISPAPDRLLPADLLLAEQRRLVVPAPDGRLLAFLATMVISQDGMPEANPPSPPAILVDGGRVTPNMLSLARAPSQTAAEYLERLAVMVARRDAADEAKRNRAAVTLADLPGLGAAGRWAERAVVDLRAYASGALPWSEIDRGVVLEGPPGCGKSTFARALANSANIAFVCGSLAKWQGDREGHLGHLLAAMRKTFDEARAAAPCVLLIDEIDSFMSRALVRHANRDYAIQVVNGLLELLDGSVERDGVLVIGACNDASSLDPALLRAGRLEQVIRIRRPDAVSLEGIFRIHLGGSLKNESIVPVAAAAASRKAVGADIERWCRDARRSARLAGRSLTLRDLQQAVGPPPEAMPPDLRWRVAVHEAGHAMAFTELGPDAVRHVNLGDGKSGQDFAFVEVTAEALSMRGPDREWMLAVMRALLAGRAAEEIVLGSVSAGAGGSERSDLAEATRIACQLAGTTGLDHHRDGLVYRCEPGAQHRMEILLAEPGFNGRVSALLQEAYAAALALLQEGREPLLRLAHALDCRGMLSAADVLALVARSGTLKASASEAATPAQSGAAR